MAGALVSFLSLFQPLRGLLLSRWSRLSGGKRGEEKARVIQSRNYEQRRPRTKARAEERGSVVIVEEIHGVTVGGGPCPG